MGAASTTVTLLFGWKGCAAVLSRDGQGGALLWEVAKLEKFECDTIGALELSYWDFQHLSAAVAAAQVTCPRGQVATLVRRILNVDLGNGLHAWHAVTQWFRPRSVVEQAASMARLISLKRTRNVNELQVAVMQWELTIVEHESEVHGGCAGQGENNSDESYASQLHA